MLHQLRSQFARHLASASDGLLCAGGRPELAALPVRYQADGLDIDLLLPRWADAAFQHDPHGEAVLAVPLEGASRGRWLICRGAIALVPSPDWSALALEQRPFVAPEDLYLVARMLPRRIDLLDETRAWGIAETFEQPGGEEFKPQE